MIALKDILVATDFSDASETALTYGRHLSRTFGATLHVLHVVDNVIGRFAADADPVLLPGLQHQLENTGEKRLIAALDDADRNELRAKAVVRMSAAPAVAIVQYAKEAGVDLIIVGTHGRGAIAHMLMGSVAERVVRTAQCPVLTVRHPEREFVHPDALVAVSRA
jgi:nucleotide-binding universal stress UspA family protein